jgi:dihydrofolate synthase/folylpolyglutamate synthase
MDRINYERTSYIPYQERQLKLDRMRQLLTRLGQPDAGLKIVHVAGTKGKGSTSAMIAAMLTAAGYRAGVFSSPHLERIEERFAVDGEPCTASEFVALVDRLKPVVRAMDEEAEREGDETGGLTYFDVTTAMALLHFVEREVDAAVLEVGLGGRLDSTNVCLPVVSVITSISFDHTKQLGNTLASIAREKAGIIKPGVPVVSGVIEPQAQAVIAEVARQHGCRLSQLGRDFDFHYQRAATPLRGVPATTPANARQGDKETRRQGEFESISPSPPLPVSPSNISRANLDFTYNIPARECQLNGVWLAMCGPHQASNAAVALAVIEEMRHQGRCISTGAMRLGLATATLPGRVEIIAGEPTIVLDTAHNEASARALIEALAELPKPARRTLVLSVSHDKDVRAILSELVPHFARIVVTQYQENPRAVPVSALAEMVEQAHPDGHRVVTQTKTPGEAWRFVRETSIPGELVCIAGSFFLAAEIRPLVLGH